MNGRKRKLWYLPAAAAGLFGLFLQWNILDHSFDANGLLRRHVPALWVLWGLVAGYLVLTAVLLPRLGENGTFRDNYPACPISGAGMILAGCVMACAGVDRLMPGQMLQGLLGMACGAGMALCGACRFMGWNPTAIPDLMLTLYYAWHLMGCYSSWNADPQLQRYAFTLLGGIAVMLFCLHRAELAAERSSRRRLVFAGFAGILLCTVAMAGREEMLFYLASALWCASAMPDLGRADFS